MTQEHAKYEQEVIYGTTYDIYKYIYTEVSGVLAISGQNEIPEVT